MTAPREQDADVVVVGAGLAGLAAALGASRAGYTVRVLEASDEVGGRVRTDLVDGFRLDRGFQILNPAYPAVRALADLPGLHPHRFWRVLRLVDGERTTLLGNPLDHPAALGGLVPPTPVTARDLLALAAVSARDAAAPARLLTGAADQPTNTELARWGFSEPFREKILARFLAGVFGEPDLDTSARFFHLVWRAFTRAAPVLPGAGIGALPRQLAEHLPAAALTLNAPVESVRPGSVHTRAGQTLRARAVVVATDPTTAADLLPDLPRPGFHGLHTFYYATDTPPLHRPVITVDARGGPVVNTAVPSTVCPGYAPAGRALVSALTLADTATEPDVRAHLARLYGCSTSGWEMIADYRIPEALPRMPAPHPLRRGIRIEPGRYVCGDHRDTSSTQGALASGTRAARAVNTDLGTCSGR